MKVATYTLVRFDADDGMVFDWAEPRYIEVLDMNEAEPRTIQEHLYVKTLFIGNNDTIANYVEVPAPAAE